MNSTFIEVKNEECTICLCTNEILYFKNICSCKHLICKRCISKITKCPFCRFVFSQSVIYSILGITVYPMMYRITDLLYPFNSVEILPEEYRSYLNNNDDSFVNGISSYWLLTEERYDNVNGFSENFIRTSNHLTYLVDNSMHFSLVSDEDYLQEILVIDQNQRQSVTERRTI